MSHARLCALALSVLATAFLLAPSASARPSSVRAQHSLRAPLTDQNFYFVMADRFENGTTANDLGGLPADPTISGFDPTAKGMYHGGDLAGLRQRLRYIRGLGTTAIWLTPSFKNRAYQPEDKSAGYHGYWVTDFTQIDPHLGTNDELAALVDDAHAMGMKVFFDIITNHTADVIACREGARMPYVSKDVSPYRTAQGVPFDDRDFAGTNAFPALSPLTSFPYHPYVPADRPTKVPDWLNDVTLYHNRGDTTFTGENSQYGDFFGLDDLFTENRRVVNGMIDVYETWIRDFGIDGFRIDTMKHVNDDFWQRFAPRVLGFARAHGKRRFFMFGEVADTTRPLTSHYVTHDRVQSILDFPFQQAAQHFAADGHPTDELRDFFAGDDWYTDADSNAYQLPTFLGNHDKGRFGRFVSVANPGASDGELLARDRLGHELMYFSRGNPVVYYGDEQGFTGDGGDQDARQDMFPSRVASYNDDDLIGTDATTAESNFDRSHPLYQDIRALARVTRRHPALRNGAQQTRWSSSAPGIFAFSRLDRRERREYVVAANNAETTQTAAVPTYLARTGFRLLYGSGEARVRTDAGKRLSVTVGPLSTVVYRSTHEVEAGRSTPSISVATVGDERDRAEVRADVGGDGFAEVTFEARVGRGSWRPIGTDDNAPYRVFHDVSDIDPGTAVRYRAVVRDLAGHRRVSAVARATVAPPVIALGAPSDNGRVRGRVEVRATATPEHPWYVVTLQRQVGAGPWTSIGTDDSSPAYTAFDDTASLPDGTTVRYRAVLRYAPGRSVTSAARTVTVVQTPVTNAIVHYRRANGDYAGWGLHLWGDAIADGVATDWTAPRPPSGTDAFGAVFQIPLKDDTKPVSFIVHQPSGNTVPDTREPGGDRSFVPLEHPEIWLVAGDPTIYFSPPS
ncbi:MAG TPA: alpha-amylase family glycosyl hydrolase [Solirubrobacteraceae bacterium]|nr:alpha-amylase family glycosyl hydrolase [Solirubrobacteraceae bacterium]